MASFLLPTTLHLTGTLPATGDWSSQNFQPCYLFDSFGFAFVYTAASNTGKPKFRVVWKDGDGNEVADIRLINFTSNPPSVDSDGGTDVVTLAAPGGVGDTVSAAITVTNPGGMASVRLEVAEAGDVANPGSVTVTVQAARN